MRLSQLGSFHQSRLSFVRILTRRMIRENWAFSRPLFKFDDRVSAMPFTAPTRLIARIP
jgi:hypothetical protein